jgi:hypothetical protein
LFAFRPDRLGPARGRNGEVMGDKDLLPSDQIRLLADWCREQQHQLLPLLARPVAIKEWVRRRDAIYAELCSRLERLFGSLTLVRSDEFLLVNGAIQGLARVEAKLRDVLRLEEAKGGALSAKPGEGERKGKANGPPPAVAAAPGQPRAAQSPPPTDPGTGRIMTASDKPTLTAFEEACLMACACAEGVARIRGVWEDYRDFGATGTSHGFSNGERMGRSLLLLTFDLEGAWEAFPAVRETIRAVHNNPPEAIAGVAGPSYHDIAIELANKAVWEIARTALVEREIRDVLMSPKLANILPLFDSLRPQVVAKFCYDRDKAPPGMWDSWRRSLDRLPIINAEAISAWVQKEAALGAAGARGLSATSLQPQSQTVPAAPSHTAERVKRFETTAERN